MVLPYFLMSALIFMLVVVQYYDVYLHYGVSLFYGVSPSDGVRC